MNKSVLIVTPFFAPQSHAAVFRAYKLAKYLPRHGWKPYVLTTDINYLYNEDPSLLSALPPEVEIIRARYIEPTLRGLRMALGGKDRTFKAIKPTLEVASASQRNAGRQQPGLLARAYRYLLEAWVQTPDRHWTWYRPAVRRAKDLIRKHRIPIVFTSAAPYTCLHIGYTLQREGCSWVADFRDPLTHCYRMHSRFDRVFLRQRNAEKMAVFNANVITTLSESYSLILTETYGLADDHPIRFITTGLDEAFLPRSGAPSPRPFPYLVFVGEYLSSYSARFFGLFAAAMENAEVKRTGTRLLFIGRQEVSQPLITPIVKNFNLEKSVEFVDHLPQTELYRYLQGALGVLLVPGRRAHWWNLYAKLVDYIALRKPVIALVPDPSEARTWLTRTGLGLLLDGDQNTCVDQLSSFLLGRESYLQPNEEECNRFLASHQVADFVNIFEEFV